MQRIVLQIIFIFSTIGSIAQSDLQKAINQLAKDPVLKSQGFSMTVMDVQSGKIIAQHQKDKGLIPASSLKVLTTSAALSILGSDFRFKTELQYSGNINEQGVLNGDLFIKGYGDPTLGSDHFDKTVDLSQLLDVWFKAIQEIGITKINGRIIGDASFFETQVDGRTWLWEDLGNYYGAGAWGLNIHDNRYFLTFQQTNQLGASPKIKKITPHIPNLHHINEVKSAGKRTGDNAYFFGTPFNYTRFIRGTIPIGSGEFKIKGAIPDPPFFTAFQLLKKLESEGIRTSNEAVSLFQLDQTNQSPESLPRKTIHTHYSPDLKTIVQTTNMKSVNLYCEAMLRYLGYHEKKQPSADAGLEVIYAFLKNKAVKTDALFLEDGSGLSPINNVSSFQMASIMRAIALDKKLYADFKPSLPVGGKSGAMKYLFRGNPIADRFFAKSGGMKRVRSYTGFVNSKQGKLLSFSIICNHFTCESGTMRKKMEPVMLKMYYE